jgi:hypothetical protein
MRSIVTSEGSTNGAQLREGKQMGRHPEAGETSGGPQSSPSETEETRQGQEGGREGSGPQELQRDGQSSEQSARNEQIRQSQETTEEEIVATPPYPAPPGYYWHNDGIWYLAKRTKASF